MFLIELMHSYLIIAKIGIHKAQELVLGICVYQLVDPGERKAILRDALFRSVRSTQILQLLFAFLTKTTLAFYFGYWDSLMKLSLRSLSTSALMTIQRLTLNARFYSVGLNFRSMLRRGTIMLGSIPGMSLCDQKNMSLCLSKNWIISSLSCPINAKPIFQVLISSSLKNGTSTKSSIGSPHYSSLGFLGSSSSNFLTSTRSTWCGPTITIWDCEFIGDYLLNPTTLASGYCMNWLGSCMLGSLLHHNCIQMEGRMLMPF